MKKDRVLILVLFISLCVGVLGIVSAQDVPDGQIVFATRITELESLHPMFVRLGRAQAVAYHINEGLVKFSPTAQIVPGLAESWEVSEDNLVYTFTLHSGVTWHDGEPFTSEDVLFTFEAAMAEDSEAGSKSTLDTYVESIEAPDDITVVLTLTQTYSPLMAQLASRVLIVPKHLLEDDINNADFTSMPVGTGPYRVTSHEVDFVQLDYNPDYWGELPKTATIILRDAPEPATQMAGLLAGELDVVAYIPNIMGRLWTQGYPIFRAPAGSVHGINLDLQNPILQDVRVRQALRLALDRSRIQLLHYTDGFIADAVVSPSYGEYTNEDLLPIARDLEAAGALLDEAGWLMNEETGIREKDGQPLTLHHYAWTARQWQDIAVIAQASWGEVGVDVEVVIVENALIAETISGQFDAAPVGWGLTVDPVVGLDLLFHSTDRTFAEGGTRNIFRYDNPEVDALLEEASAITDPERRTAIVREIQEYIYNDVPFIPVAYPTYALVAQPGILLDETGLDTLSGVAGVGWFMNLWDITD